MLNISCKQFIFLLNLRLIYNWVFNCKLYTSTKQVLTAQQTKKPMSSCLWKKILWNSQTVQVHIKPLPLGGTYTMHTKWEETVCLLIGCPEGNVIRLLYMTVNSHHVPSLIMYLLESSDILHTVFGDFVVNITRYTEEANEYILSWEATILSPILEALSENNHFVLQEI